MNNSNNGVYMKALTLIPLVLAIASASTLASEESQEVISDDKEHVHSRYLDLYKLLQNSNKKMALLFDRHSRSKAWIQLIAIRSAGLSDISQ